MIIGRYRSNRVHITAKNSASKSGNLYYEPYLAFCESVLHLMCILRWLPNYKV